MREIRRVAPQEMELFRPLVFEQYQKYMQAVPPTPVLAVGVWINDRPRGVLLFLLPEKIEHRPSLLSIFVNPFYRRQGIGERLMQEGEELLQELGYKGAMGQYEQSYKMVAATEALLTKVGWSYEPFRFMYYSTHYKVLEDRLLERMTKLPTDYSFCLWETIRPEEEAFFKAKFERNEVSPQYFPFDALHAAYLPHCSLGIRYQGQLVGWMIMLPHHLPHHLYFANLYVLPEHASKGFGLGMVYEATRLDRLALGAAYYPEKNIILFQAFYENAPMVRTSEKRLAKHCHLILRYNLAKKAF